MDVYGYHAYQYNQSEELAKQMLAHQQALTSSMSSSMPFNRGVPEPHTMPAPSGIPWNVQGLPWGMSSPPQVVQFTASDCPTYGKPTLVPHCKRKSLDIEPVIPAKQLITEEKMAATLNGLHISSDYTPHTLAADEVMDIGMDTPTPSTSMNITEKLKGHTIVLSEEVKKIREEPLLPAALIERLEKPRMSLVVWKPRENILEKIIEDDKDKKQEEEQLVKRNGVLVAESAGMDIEM